MGRKGNLTLEERYFILSELEKGRTTLEISKIMQRCHRTVQKCVIRAGAVCSRADKNISRAVSRQQISRIELESVINPFLTSGELFKRCGEEHISKSTRCRILKNLAKPINYLTYPSLKAEYDQIKNRHLQKWHDDYIEIDFSKTLCILLKIESIRIGHETYRIFR